MSQHIHFHYTPRHSHLRKTKPSLLICPTLKCGCKICTRNRRGGCQVRVVILSNTGTRLLMLVSKISHETSETNLFGVAFCAWGKGHEDLRPYGATGCVWVHFVEYNSRFGRIWICSEGPLFCVAPIAVVSREAMYTLLARVPCLCRTFINFFLRSPQPSRN